MAFVRQTIEINGCKLSLRRAAAGVPLIYLHGTDGLAEWPAMLDTLAEKFDVIAPDHPGFGASEVPAWIDDVSDVAYLYLDMIEKLGLSGLHVVGQSLGGWIALEMAVRSTHAPAQPHVDLGGRHPRQRRAQGRYFHDRSRGAGAPRLCRSASSARKRPPRAGADKYQDLAVLNRIASARFGWQPRFFNPAARALAASGERADPCDLGRGRPHHSAGLWRGFHRLIPGSTLTMIPDAGHLPHVERADAVAQAMQTFLQN